MTTDGGGWTRVWKQAVNDYGQTNFSYNTPLETVANSTEMMTGFTTSSNVLSNLYSFDIPANFKTQHPFNNTSFTKGISAKKISDGTTVNTTLYSGYWNYTNTCTAPFFSNEYNVGKFCLSGTDGAGYYGFGYSSYEFCSPSNGSWNAYNCGPERRFVIYVR